MQAAPARYVSVSELYSTDEVELLLDEIRELEPTSCRGEDVQDFEIAGSGCGAGGAGGRSPCGTEATERSWDSHAQYRRAQAVRARPLAPLYCRLRHLVTARGATQLAVVMCCAAAAGCVWGAVGLRAGSLPLAPRVQLLQLAALSSALLHATLLAMHVTGLRALLPLDWDRLGTWTSLWSVVSLASGSALTIHALLCSPSYLRAPLHLARLLYSASVRHRHSGPYIYWHRGGLSLASGSALTIHALLCSPSYLRAPLHLARLLYSASVRHRHSGPYIYWHRGGLSLASGSALTIHALLCSPSYLRAPLHLARLLYSASGLGLGGACASGALAAIGGHLLCRCRQPPASYLAVPSAPGPAPIDNTL